MHQINMENDSNKQCLKNQIIFPKKKKKRLSGCR
uniref:Uncharacterized protein n=1 Tax=Rhizophora mucronata TaxID=61149 RepID=A0A2P2J387_RHIMU